MKILVVGGGAREHAIVKALIRTGTPAENIICAPGNELIAKEVTTHPEIVATDKLAVATLALQHRIDLAVIGPEAPLVAGVSDALREQGIAVFGPSQQAAMLEGSKNFAKEVMAAADVPTGMARECSSLEQVEDALDQFGAPYVVKADGLAAGKGVIVTSDKQAALDHAAKFIEDGVLVEEFLDGQEVSLFFLSDGKSVMPLSPAQDYKRAYDNDEGPNTGGMGAYSPIPWLPEGFVEEVTERVAQPTVNEMARRGTEFVGLLYCGLILTSRGVKVIEFNARFGDPETQVVLRRLQSNLADLLMRSATGKLENGPGAEFSPRCAVTVVLASEGYPVTNAPVREVFGIESAEAMDDVEVCKASPTGRVLSVVGCGQTFQEARTLAYEGMARISLEGGFYRHDIGLKVS
ncbi:phosphoribosylamine--glycine ligase [Aquiluna sp. KACHI24]|uniref:phosphoribosylamine--glycine ligase n=1 Tax=Aquiluna sp. KACHI24 TaxID=2968831 RepID=UPI0022096F47|nr:phosphoribosylamine--glycine ligase [Aquiluna sp. KACHI24]BDQ00922.1 phosphoribosylamine--glycine ligase [Aquiluna sp. KACHI24]